ncbi:hypothetical protein HYDPIDRAFT_44606 [Hydnomerulius pinastri MD-312]|uniref:Uncharacterized protein n=1 Tax=Hydnomerulius pinastri MD-312 TaxID=994086 RepID=A0A0C9W762_9AGAM|nr:hypothetical protein HYDPIDRAFT_44606 [Hydnomerulius pinastri MD-312]
MPPKRPLDVYDSPVSSTPPRGPKRRQLVDSLPPSSPFASSSSIFATPQTPRTPAYTWIVPADSPTNPFGRIRRLTQGTTLPRPTSFSKHLPLRFQLVHPRADGRNVDRDGVYRVVQVPLTYTLAHLRKVIEYVFDPASDSEIIEPYNLRRPSRRLSRGVASNKGKQPELVPVGHLFEVQKRVTMGRHGEIKEAQTWIKASTVRDPYHYPGNESEDSLWLEDEGEGSTWRWEAEEDLTLMKVWPKGGDLARGITYHHDSETQIHITVNTKKIQSRKGVGNKPFLFMANGSVSLPDPDDTLRMGAVETLRWNRIGAYDKYLKAEAEKERAARGEEADEEDEDAEAELDPDMSSSTLPLYELSSSPFSIISSNPVTPFPAEPSLRRRVDYEHKRLLKITKAGLKDAGLSDEEEKEAEDGEDDDFDPAFEEKPSDWDPFGDEAEIC